MKLFIIGATLVIVFWIISWTKITPFYIYAFFPLWLGYTLAINGISQKLFYDSLLKRMQWSFLYLFLISIPFWWLFEFLNNFVNNWYYSIATPINPLMYLIFGSIAFSIVVPAVLSTSLLFFQVTNKIHPIQRQSVKITNLILFLSFFLGLFFLSMVITTPQASYPLLWSGLFLLIEPINYCFKFSSLYKKISDGSWTLFVSICLATLFTGFWWELWNYYSYPKWFYTIPDLGFFKIFEMPILGFLGYPFFGLEVYSITVLILGILNRFFGVSTNFSKKDL